MWAGQPRKHATSITCLFKVGPMSATLSQHWANIESRYVFCWVITNMPANTRHCASVALKLSHRLRRWSNTRATLAQRLVLAGNHHGGGLRPSSENEMFTMCRVNVGPPSVWGWATWIDAIGYRIKPEELYILSCEKDRGRGLFHS